MRPLPVSNSVTSQKHCTVHSPVRRTILRYSRACRQPHTSAQPRRRRPPTRGVASDTRRKGTLPKQDFGVLVSKRLEFFSGILPRWLCPISSELNKTPSWHDPATGKPTTAFQQLLRGLKCPLHHVDYPVGLWAGGRHVCGPVPTARPQTVPQEMRATVPGHTVPMNAAQGSNEDKLKACKTGKEESKSHKTSRQQQQQVHEEQQVEQEE